MSYGLHILELKAQSSSIGARSRGSLIRPLPIDYNPPIE